MGTAFETGEVMSMSTARQGWQPVLGCPGQHRIGHRVGVKNASIHSTTHVSSWIVPSSPTPGLRYLVKNFFLLFFFSFLVFVE